MKYCIDNLVINSNQIVSVRYDPERSGIDDETYEPYHTESHIAITTTAIELDCEIGYEGHVDGVGSRSQVIKLRGAEADLFWEVYSVDAFKVV